MERIWLSFPVSPAWRLCRALIVFAAVRLQTIVLCNAGLLGAFVAFVAWRRRKNLSE